MQHPDTIPNRTRRKLRDECGLTSAEGFPQMGATHYLDWLPDLHRQLRPDTYFEIGTESGASLAFARCFSIAVDPQFRLQADVSRNKPALLQFQTTSDAFFASGMLERLGRRVDLAFLDGLHLFEALLRDFIHIERHMAPDGVIAMHDCVPINATMALRDRADGGMWTGDVWKVVAILRKYRPDLRISCLDLAPTGLVVVQGLDPANTILSDRLALIEQEFAPLTLDTFGQESFRRMIDLTPAAAFRPDRAAVPARPKTRPRIAIKACTPSAAEAENWGDTHFARSLARAFQRKGFAARVDCMSDWGTAPADDALDIVLQGHDYHPPRDGIPALMWYIYPGKRFDPENFSRYGHVFAASRPFLRRLRRDRPGLSCSFLPQAFDAETMAPGPTPPGQIHVFVGNNHFGHPRPVVELALAAGIALDIHGSGWTAAHERPHVVAPVVANSDLGRLYAGARAVLCDHSAPMRRQGFVSNRIFDALACAAPVICDAVADLPAAFAPFVFRVETAADLAAAVAAICAEDAPRRAERIAFATALRETDSFDARAETILTRAHDLGLL
ncbi:glycosyl transferase family 1 [Cereibacter ovatus]|uniref:Glycosyl transferase family 1 n=1 Tax=Cereibacter ovatus TaxID=439529 RepID=A0A285CUA3_9RHOB|nr:class I SAM-dependent methyltransferase [Cereibacter ovatus]SNX71122.1 glycosyl transferase family 1 [Cereibacter ovatus]